MIVAVFILGFEVSVRLGVFRVSTNQNAVQAKNFVRLLAISWNNAADAEQAGSSKIERDSSPHLVIAYVLGGVSTLSSSMQVSEERT